jgi:predicted HTH domain antitoxin
MSLVISDEVIHATRMSEQEVAQALAVALFQKEKLTLGQAARLGRLTQIEFQHLLASQGIPVHYGLADFEQDLATLRSMGQL